MRTKIAIIVLVLIIFSLSFVQGKSLSSEAYDFFMSSEYRPITKKDLRLMNRNLDNLKEMNSFLKSDCSTEILGIKEIEEKIEKLPFSSLVIDTRKIKKELLYLTKKANEEKRKCQGEISWSTNHLTTFNITNKEFSKKISHEHDNYLTKIENLGKTKISPKLIINDKDTSSLQSITSRIISPEMEDKEKAYKIWEFVKSSKYHFLNPTKYVEKDSLDLINYWGYGNCGFTSRTVIDLASLAGLKAREHRLGGHIVSEIFYDNSWHVFDSDGAVIYPKENGELASVTEIEQDLSLLEKWPSLVYSVEYLKKAYSNKKNNVVVKYSPKNPNKRLSFELRPHESIIFMKNNRGNYFVSADYSEPEEYSNSFFKYNPKKVSGLTPFTYSYPLVGGSISGISKQPSTIYFSEDNHNWKKVALVIDQFEVDYTSFIRNGYGEPLLEYYLYIEGDIENPTFVSEVQAAPRSLPFLEVGENKIQFTDLNNNQDVNAVVSFLSGIKTSS